MERASRPATEVVDAAAVGRGAVVAIAVCLPLALVSRQVVGEEEASPLSAVLFLAVLVGLSLGGFVAARSASSAPFTNGGLAALAAFVVIQGTALVVRLLDGDAPSAPALVFNAILAFGSGVAGGAVASRRSRPQRGRDA